jgi:integrase
MMSKKANGEGSITKRADGRFMGRYTLDGKRKTIYGNTHAEVRAEMNKIMSDISKGEYVEPNSLTTGAWLREWLEVYALVTVKQSTYVSYEGYVRLHLGPELGNIKLIQLSAESIQRFFNKKKKTLSPKYLKNIYNMLHASLDQAVINKKLGRNPTFGVKLPPIPAREMRVLSTDEQSALQTAVLRCPELQAFGIIFALNTGVRLGELLAFQWKDLDTEKHCIKVRRTLGRLQKVDENGQVSVKTNAADKTANSTEIVIRTPKTATSAREIPLFPELWEGLMAYRQRQLALVESLGDTYGNQDFIFCTMSGKPQDPRVYEDIFKRALKAAAVGDANFHSLRHTFATRALESGMDIKVLSAILGHAQASTTLNRYGHALPDHKKVSMEKMRGFYVGENPKTGSDTNGWCQIPADLPFALVSN